MNLFSHIRLKRPKLNKFDLSHERKLSLNFGYLYPIYVQDIVPGDKFRVSSEMLIRMAPMIAPVMHRINAYVHFFFVPNRLVWDEWEDFITGGTQGTANPLHPYGTYAQTLCDEGYYEPGKLADYIGLPVFTSPAPTVTNEEAFSVIPFRAYHLIYDEYYRDQNLTNAIDPLKTSGLQSVAEMRRMLTLRKRAWEKDYFTSCLPWAQRGTAVSVQADIEYANNPMATFQIAPGAGANIQATNAANPTTLSGSGGAGIMETFENLNDIGININTLRRSVKLQEWLEKNARGGARYIEQILSHFGVQSSDARLQRPEYLGGGRTPITISEVLNTSGDTLPQGNMAGHGIGHGLSNQFSKRFEEHGYVIGIMSVLPRTAYQQGIPRHLLRTDKFDYYWPELANIGEQEVRTRELWYDQQSTQGAGGVTFGYQSRYAEYKYMPSTVHGQFRTSLDFWHMGRIFGNEPVLNTDFVEANPSDRIFATLGNEHMYVQVYNNVQALRPMPYFGTPSL